MLRSIAVALAGSILMFALYYALGGSLLPVSGMVKQARFRWSLPLYIDLLMRGLRFAVPWLADSGRRTPEIAALTLAIPVGLTALSALIYRRRSHTQAASSSQTRVYVSLFIVSSVAVALHTVYFAGLHSYADYGVWYQVPLTIWGMFAAAILAFWWVDHLVWKPAQLLTISVVLVATAAFVPIYDGFWTPHISAGVQSNAHYVRMQLARWVDSNLPPDAVIGAWNAGELAYFMRQPVVNLDGLINSPEYFYTVLSSTRSVSLADYLASRNVTYLIDYALYLPEPWRDNQVYLAEVVNYPNENFAVVTVAEPPTPAP